jgi:4-hydroxy-tetrahydrodipicolinate reductase
MKKKIRVLQFGLGPIGLAAARLVLEKSGLALVGALDIDPAKVGKDLGDVLSVGRLGIPVVSRLADLPRTARPEVALHCTVSWLEQAAPQIEELAKAGLHVVSSSEELLYPDWKYPRLAARLRRLALMHGVTLLGTGVNPGFVLDTVPILLSSACTHVREVKLERVVDAGTRRLPLQKKVGAGMSPSDFRRELRAGRMGHAGFIETVAIVAKSLGWKLDSIVETIKPKLAERETPSLAGLIQPGQVTGIHQTCRGRIGGKSIINADLQMFVGAPRPFDRIVIAGEPGIDCRFEGGVAGDQATVAMLVNAIPLVCEAGPGLKTVVDLPVPRWMGD